MTRAWRRTAAMLLAIGLGMPGSAHALDPVSAYVLKYLGETVVQEVWNASTGKPDVWLLDRRLKELEQNGVLRSEMRDEVERLRRNINGRVTREEFKAMASRVAGEIGSIKRRLDALELRVERLEVENADQKNGTKDAASPAAYVARGETFERAKEAERALANFSLAIELDPSCAAAYRGRCRVYEGLGAPGVVVADATEALGHVKGGDAAWFHRARAVAQGQLWKLRPYEFVSGWSSRDVKWTLEQDDANRFWKDCREGVGAADAVSDATLHALRGMSYLKAADQTDSPGPGFDAKGDVNKLIDGITAARRPWYENARAAFEQALGADPSSSLARCCRGVAAERLGRNDDARADYQDVIRRDPSYQDTYVALAGITEKDGAIALLTRALELVPDDVKVLEARARRYSVTNKDEVQKFIADYRRITEIDPTYAAAFSALGNAYYHAGDTARSREYSQKGFELEEARRAGTP